MNDYKELIELLAHPADGRDNADIMISAADAIEHLVKERDEWQNRYYEQSRKRFQFEQERDAAVDDLKSVLESECGLNQCRYCKYQEDTHPELFDLPEMKGGQP